MPHSEQAPKVIEIVEILVYITVFSIFFLVLYKNCFLCTCVCLHFYNESNLWLGLVSGVSYGIVIYLALNSSNGSLLFYATFDQLSGYVFHILLTIFKDMAYCSYLSLSLSVGTLAVCLKAVRIKKQKKSLHFVISLLNQEVQVALREEIKSACEYRPFEKCDYSSRISNEICCKKLEYVTAQLDLMKQTINEYDGAV